MAGRALAGWARLHWKGSVEEALLIEAPLAGSVPQLRMAGMAAAIRELLPGISDRQFVRIDGRATFGATFAAVRHYFGVQLGVVSWWAPSTTPAPWARCGLSRRPAAERTAP
jgi:hypothetical protein